MTTKSIRIRAPLLCTIVANYLRSPSPDLHKPPLGIKRIYKVTFTRNARYNSIKVTPIRFDKGNSVQSIPNANLFQLRDNEVLGARYDKRTTRKAESQR